MTDGQDFMLLNRRRQHPLAWLRGMGCAAAFAALPTVINDDRWYYAAPIAAAAMVVTDIESSFFWQLGIVIMIQDGFMNRYDCSDRY